MNIKLIFAALVLLNFYACSLENYIRRSNKDYKNYYIGRVESLDIYYPLEAIESGSSISLVALLSEKDSLLLGCSLPSCGNCLPGTVVVKSSIRVALVKELESYSVKHKLVFVRSKFKAMRMLKLWGMNLSQEQYYLVFLEANTPQIFRDCEDPEVTDCVCSNVPHASAYTVPDSAVRSLPPNNFLSTKRGYMFDWKKKLFRKDKMYYSMSEFFIKAGSSITVSRIVPLGDWLFNKLR